MEAPSKEQVQAGLGHRAEPLATAMRLADASNALTGPTSKQVTGERGMSPNPPRQKHQQGNTSKNLIATFILWQREEQAPTQEEGKRNQMHPHLPSGPSALCLGGSIILLEERERDIFSCFKMNSQKLLGADSLN